MAEKKMAEEVYEKSVKHGSFGNFYFIEEHHLFTMLC